MSGFSIGDKAWVKKKVKRTPWVDGMNQFVGGVYEVVDISQSGDPKLRCKGIDFWFPVEALGLVKPHRDPNWSPPKGWTLEEWEKF